MAFIVAPPGKVLQKQKTMAATRNKDLHTDLLSILESLAVELNVGIVVQSGGQMKMSEWEAIRDKSPDRVRVENNSKGKPFKYFVDGKSVRVGSKRHDDGKAADINVFAPEIGSGADELLNDDSPNEKEKAFLQKFVAHGKKKGLKGFGSGEGYMNNYATFHVDTIGTEYGGSSLWGKNSSSTNTPSWLSEAFNNPDKFLTIGSLEAAEKTLQIPAPTPPLPQVRPPEPYDGPVPQIRPNSTAGIINASYTNVSETGPTQNPLSSILGTGGQLAASTFPGITSNIASSFLPENLKSLAPFLTDSFSTGKGISPLNDLLDVTSFGSVENRLGYLSQLTEKYPSLTDTVSGIAGLDLKEALPSILSFGETNDPTERFSKILESMDSLEPITVGDVVSGNDLGTLSEFYKDNENFADQNLSRVFDVENLTDEGKTLLRGVSAYVNMAGGIDKAIEDGNTKSIFAKALFGTNDDKAKALDYFIQSSEINQTYKENARTLLTGSLDEIVGSGVLGPTASMLLDPSVSRNVMQETISALTKSEVEEKGLMIGDQTISTMLFGSENEKDGIEAREEIVGLVTTKLMETNPILANILSLFENNKGLITLLGSAGVLSGLSGLLGGGMLGGLAAGAGGVFAARMALGPEGFNQLNDTIKQAAAPAFDMISNLFNEGGMLSSIDQFPMIQNILNTTLDMGRDNPLAAMALATGNVGAAAGLVLGMSGIDIGLLDNKINPEDLIKNLSNDDPLRLLDAAGLLNASQTRPEVGSGAGKGYNDNELQGQTQGKPSQGFNTPELYVSMDTSHTNDYSWGGVGVQGSIA